MARTALLVFAIAALPLASRPVHASNCGGTHTGLVPLTALGTGTYQGYVGGLYPGGSNARPFAHDAAGVAIADAIAPIDSFGLASAGGRIVMISIGMSNTTQEFSAFVPLANADPLRNPRVQVIDCALGGQTAALIKNPTYAYWDTVRTRLRGRGSSPLQVQVVWLKEANAGPTGGFPAATLTLMSDEGSVVRTIKSLFPNVRIAYLSSRIYAGYATSALNPEPYAYESGFAVKWLIEGQIAGADSLNFDPAQGVVAAPWLSWGPYLWADGLTPRPGDGLTWACSDFQASDGTHPAAGARQKVSNLLLDFLHTDRTAQPWYLATPTAVPMPATEPGRLEVAPNPSLGVANLAFATRSGEPWRLEIVDAAGRRVRTIGAGVGDGSGHALRWDGRDQDGSRVAAGVYWARLVGVGQSDVRRVVMLRPR